MNIIMPLFFVAAIVVFIVQFVLKQKRRKAVAAYGTSQGWLALATDDATLGSYVPDALKGLGYSHSYDMAYAANIAGHKTVLFYYDYVERDMTTSSDMTTTNNDHHYTFSVVTFEVPQDFDTLFLRRNSLFDYTGNYHRKDFLGLEGNFDKYFKTYVPDEMRLEALTLLTPDFMQFLIDKGSNYDLQFNHHFVSVIGSGKLITAENIPTLTTFISELSTELASKR